MQSSLDVSANEFVNQLDPQNTVDELAPVFDLELDDSQLVKMTASQLQADIDHWEQEPWLLPQTDKENISYLLGIQDGGKVANPNTQTPYVDNRLFTAVRAILAYTTGQAAKPEILPSKPDDKFKHLARQLQMALYQHALDHEVNTEMRLAVKNLITRKRGFLKLRYDDDYGPYGDICTENIDPADIVISRHAGFQSNPERIYHRQKATVQGLIEKFPDKEAEIYEAIFGKSEIRGVHTQMTRLITYWECWFTYYNKDNEQAEGVCWFIKSPALVLGKMQNPNWIYKGSKKNQLIVNMTYCPIKPFIVLNYWNTGRSYIDETCLFDQARPQQDILNKRGRQIVENADYANPRILANGALWDEGDAKKFVNKSPKTIGLLNNMAPDANIQNAVTVINPTPLPSYVIEDKFDARNEIDTMMGTPTQFRGQMANTKNPTLGQDLLIKNQAGALQDDLVSVVHQAWRQYYLYLVQMMNTYLPDDYYVMVRGEDGEYTHIMLNQESIDTNVRLSVRTDSTLPLDKESQRATAIQLAQIGRIDDLSLFELLGMPDPEKLAERKLRWEIDRMGYLNSVHQRLLSDEAEQDIALIIAGREPAERDDYSEDYINYFNHFLTSNRYQRLTPDVQQKLQTFLNAVANQAATTLAARESMLDPAGITEDPINPAMPQKQIRLVGQLDPATAAQLAGVSSQSGQGSAPAPKGQPSPPKPITPSQFTVH